MAEFFRQLITQLSAIWQRLSLQQKIITASLVGFMFLGMIGLMMWGRVSPSSSAAGGYKVLYSNLELDDASTITAKLQENGYKYKLDNNGTAILVESAKVYEARMSLARDGLPKSKGIGYEIFDKTNYGVTDYVQKLNSKRALEGELQRTIEGLEEVKSVRVHIVMPEESVFLESQREAKASIIVKTAQGRTLSKDQIRGMTHLVASGVEGLQPQNISVIDYSGKLLSSPYGDDPGTLASSRNVELQQNVEKYLESKSAQILEGILGPGKSQVKIAVDMDFDRAEKNIETYNPESKVVRSEERTDESVKNSPTGDAQKEHSTSNYEIDKTVEHVVRAIGSVKRLTISVAIDGRYEMPAKGAKKDAQPVYVARTTEELQKFEDMIKNAVGYDVARGDQITVSNVQFNNEFLANEQQSIQNDESMAFRMSLVKYGIALIIAIMFIFFLRYLAKTIADAMNPPVPNLQPFGVVEVVPEVVPENVRKSSELLERVEMLTREEPVNIAAIIRQWLTEPAGASAKKK